METTHFSRGYNKEFTDKSCKKLSRHRRTRSIPFGRDHHDSRATRARRQPRLSDFMHCKIGRTATQLRVEGGWHWHGKQDKVLKRLQASTKMHAKHGELS